MDKDSIVKHLDKLYNKLSVANSDLEYLLIKADINYFEAMLIKIGEEYK